MPTPLFPTFDKRISDATERILRAQIDPWLFMSSGLNVKTFDGRKISYHGIKFETGPRHVFWSRYIEPFLENLIVSELVAGVTAAKERRVDARELIPEIQGLLLSAVAKVLARMADVDRRLRGDGFPQQVQLRNTQSEFAGISEFIDRQVQAELRMWHVKPAYEIWYEENRFLVWVVGAVIGLLSFAAALL